MATRIDGNVGLLGEDDPGYVEVDDAAALAAMMARCRDEPSFPESLAQACARRAPLFLILPWSGRGFARSWPNCLLGLPNFRAMGLRRCAI